ncbi:Phosphoserine phosphatase RsbP [Phycisphaerae bacterium RAS1]|nr:Phosphoserine phosphatase RsbP [Phycisphaerae bacterium RAS1]
MVTSGANVLLWDALPERAAEVRLRLEQRGFRATQIGIEHAGGHRDGDLAVVVLGSDGPCEDPAALTAMIESLEQRQVTTLVWGDPTQLPMPANSLIESIPADVSFDELIGRLSELARYAPLVHRLERELQHFQRLGDHMNKYFGEIGQEMRLAGRLQRDFLPRVMPSLPPLRFATLYRPASWVSGDIYDVARIDSHQAGVFIADAMGHGVAAGLLTMFVQQSMITKRIEAGGYRFVTPGEAIETLNDCLVRQKLPNCQFLTAAYATIDSRTFELRMARGGHPYPLWIKADGEMTEIRAVGGLLGVPDIPAEFEETTVKLAAGDKVVFYSDGVEDILLKPKTDRNSSAVEFTDHMLRWSRTDADTLINSIGDHLDRQEGSLHPADDVTVVVVEVER